MPDSFLLILVLFRGLSTLLNPFDEPNWETPEFPDRIFVYPLFIRDIFIVDGKFLRLFGND